MLKLFLKTDFEICNQNESEFHKIRGPDSSRKLLDVQIVSTNPILCSLQNHYHVEQLKVKAVMNFDSILLRHCYIKKVNEH